MARAALRVQAAGRWPDDVEVWRLLIPATLAELDLSVLDEGERMRAARFYRDADRVRYVATRTALRALLGERVGVRPSLLRFSTAHRGKPELVLAGNAPSFNVSHSGEHALIAISTARDVGIDVEHVDPELNWQPLLDLVCTDAERQTLLDEPQWRQRESFFRFWTAKEALLKTIGVGIAEGLRALEVSLIQERIQARIVSGNRTFANIADLQYQWLTDIPEYMACVAYGRPSDGQDTSSAGRHTHASGMTSITPLGTSCRICTLTP
jgi:4'-phosphopantetheinyl transferase